MKYSIGIDLGGTNIAAGVVDENAVLVSKCSLPTRAERSPEEVIRDMAKAAEEAVRLSGVSPADVVSVGAGIPGACRLSDSSVLAAENLHWRNVPLGSLLEPLLKMPVSLGNDADCAALGEVLAGCAKDVSSALMITIGTGIGGGLILNRKIFSGGTGAGTEPGHTPMVFGGVRCGCGMYGCFEAYASCTALIRQTREAMGRCRNSLLWKVCGGDPENVSGKTPFEAADRGDKTAKKVLDRYISYLACGIGGLVNVFRPELVVIGGGVSGAGDDLIVPLNAKLREYCFGADVIAPPPVRRAALGNDAGIIGAAFTGKK